jgi:hypothetical protein
MFLFLFLFKHYFLKYKQWCFFLNKDIKTFYSCGFRTRDLLFWRRTQWPHACSLFLFVGQRPIRRLFWRTASKFKPITERSRAKAWGNLWLEPKRLSICTLLLRIRVTRFGEFTIVYFDQFFNYISSPHFCSTFFISKGCALILTKHGLGLHFGRFCSQTHQVTLLRIENPSERRRSMSSHSL